MQITQSLNHAQSAGCVLTIGNFDGVHIGHQHIIKKVISTAEKHGLESALMTFTSHPKCIFSICDNYLLSTVEEKQKYIEQHGINHLFLFAFDKQFASISAQDFIHFLVQQLNIKYLLVGGDFRFGYQGKGNFKLLESAAKQYQFHLERIPTQKLGQQRISSSLVRDAIRQADFGLAQTLLNRDFSYHGKVIKGKQLGRTINFPTANLAIDDAQLLPSGVFAVIVSLAKSTYKGVCNIGIKPTLAGKIRQLEVHLFDFSKEIYDQDLRIIFIKKIRDEQKFSSIDALKVQIAQDAKLAKQILADQKIRQASPAIL